MLRPSLLRQAVRTGSLIRPAARAGPSVARPAALPLRPFSVSSPPGARNGVHFVDSKGNPIKTIEGNEGDDLLSLAHEYDVDLEDPESFDKLPEADDEENDMLDLAFGLEDT
ncbi:hypothetical protein A1Q2_03551 [Trichosporon asahii var. asahii CBS 8904]|uniref:Uncharacterized protein n=2 Tax=Trichosporon asahii var. asahii TaxID=189963 RepID=K1WM45_TRIAC|nr:hypothetical protein A1Q1_07453 [Trichosporon asahii var. asahii CBS 2479]EJT53215.1 hypothetical protein A1Q1_07453 [Trichosporon asahii var. asahii CBS 2479]EKD02189.1 hypothetical protein A1Q2_03551 [Trichosporon asahii var. asahii CBS 8904]